MSNRNDAAACRLHRLLDTLRSGYNSCPGVSMQATSLLTPIIATLAGEKPSRGVWLGCCFTLAGTVLITLDHSASAAADDGSSLAASSLGKLCACAAYAGPSMGASGIPNFNLVCRLAECVLHGIGGDSLILAAAFFYSVVLLYLPSHSSCSTQCH